MSRMTHSLIQQSMMVPRKKSVLAAACRAQIMVQTEACQLQLSEVMFTSHVMMTPHQALLCRLLAENCTSLDHVAPTVLTMAALRSISGWSCYQLQLWWAWLLLLACLQLHSWPEACP